LYLFYPIKLYAYVLILFFVIFDCSIIALTFFLINYILEFLAYYSILEV